MYRQGDVLIMAAQIPAGAIRRKDKVVELGEATGHKHQFLNAGVELLEQYAETYIRASEPSPLVHEEHETIVIPEGTYRVIRQREFQGEDSRYVRD